MIHIFINETSVPFDNIPIFLNNENWVLFDIETTGFDRTTTKVILIGMLFLKDNQIILKQVFIDSLDEEILLLTEFIKDIENRSLFITFNGNMFDIPYLNSRYKNNNINYVIKRHKNLDVYQYFKNNKDIYNLPNAKLKTIEKVLGISRKDTIDGRESIKLYFEYLKSKDSYKLEKILLHNEDDIINLLKLFIKTLSLDEKLLNFSPKIINIQNQNVYIKDIDISNKIIHLQLIKNDYLSYHYYKNDFILDFVSKDQVLQLPILKFNSNLDEYVFADTNMIFNIDFDLLDTNQKNRYLISINDFYYYDNLSNIINKKIDLI